MASTGLWLALLVPALNVWQSWYQGAIVHSRRTRGISEAVLLYLISSAVLLALGAVWGQTPGLYIGLGVMTISTAVQTFWLWYRAKPAMSDLLERDLPQPETHLDSL
jgi:hypothetical protein